MSDNILLIDTQGINESVKNESALWLEPDPFQGAYIYADKNNLYSEKEWRP